MILVRCFFFCGCMLLEGGDWSKAAAESASNTSSPALLCASARHVDCTLCFERNVRASLSVDEFLNCVLFIVLEKMSSTSFYAIEFTFVLKFSVRRNASIYRFLRLFIRSFTSRTLFIAISSRLRFAKAAYLSCVTAKKRWLSMIISKALSFWRAWSVLSRSMPSHSCIRTFRKSSLFTGSICSYSTWFTRLSAYLSTRALR